MMTRIMGERWSQSQMALIDKKEEFSSHDVVCSL